MRDPLKRQLLTWCTVVLALALVFMSYLNPHWQRDLAQRVWACF